MHKHMKTHVMACGLPHPDPQGRTRHTSRARASRGVCRVRWPVPVALPLAAWRPPLQTSHETADCPARRGVPVRFGSVIGAVCVSSMGGRAALRVRRVPCAVGGVFCRQAGVLFCNLVP